MDRRDFITGLAGASVCGLMARPSFADTSMDVPFDVTPPLETREKFVAWMRDKRKEDAAFLALRWDRLQDLIAKKDVWENKNIRGFMLTPREEFVTKANLARTYVWHYLDIGYGVTITGPHTVARMTSTIDVSPDDKVLEIGTGSGYQSAYLSNLTKNLWTIEIIPALAERTRHVYDTLIARGYSEYAAIKTKNADGYYGWEEFAPFDKIIVTCGIDHVPPPLLHQLKPGGIMVIPVGPPGAQHVLKVATTLASNGNVAITRSDIYGGTPIPFVPLTKLEGNAIVGTHNN